MRTAFTILFIVICLALIVVVLMQEGKEAGFGTTFTGEVDSYARKNHGRTREGKLEKATVILGVLFFLVAIGLCMKAFM